MAAPKSERSGFNLWIVLFFFSLALAAVLCCVTVDFARQGSAKEAQNIEEALGTETLDDVNAIATTWYTATASNLTKYTEEGDGGKFDTWVSSRVDALLDLAYWFYRRVALFILWLPWWIPMLALAMVHGSLDRAIKKTDFGYTSPVKNHLARQTVNLCLMATMIAFVLPFAIDPLIFPIFMAIATICTGIAIGNIQKRI